MIQLNEVNFILILKDLLSLEGGKSFKIQTVFDCASICLEENVDKQKVQNEIAHWLDLRRTDKED